MIEQLPVQEGGTVAFRLSGKLRHADYQAFLPRLESLIEEEGRLSVLLELDDFHGWDLEAAWDDFRFGMEHQTDFARIALVGKGALQHWMAVMAKPFVNGEVRFFERDDLGAAWDWLRDPQRQAEADRAEPPPYRQILVGVDFSAHAERAVHRAVKLGEQADARIILVHAVESYGLYDEFYDPIIPLKPDLDLELSAAARQKLDAMIQDLGAGKLQAEVMVGSPKAVVLSQAEAMQADLIVLGQHGRRGISRLLGSTAAGVIAGARCDVVTVRVDGNNHG
jgi:nucleotide-binding universal stress UspA family protein